MARVRLALLGVVVVAAACASSPSSARHAQETRAPLPAGRSPSKISKMVCAVDAQREIADALGLKAVVQTPTWVQHRYSCRYTYPNGSFTLSVQELSSWSQTVGYFRSLHSSLGDTGSVANLGQGAFSTTDGSVVVRKDWKVLFVDITGLPSQFGVPPTSASDVAVTVADVILGCWDGD
ncbi:MAG: hypothetical protein ABSG81_14615 [Acidimicrobiales bacterium]